MLKTSKCFYFVLLIMIDQAHRKKIWSYLSVTNEFFYFIGAIFFIVGSALANVDMKKYAFHTAWNFIVGSICYLLGASSKLLADTWKLKVAKGKPPLSDRLNFWASIFFTIGGILFTIGAGMFIMDTLDWIVRAEIVWDIGSGSFLVGAVLKATCDQLILSHLYRDGTKDIEKQKTKVWLNVIGTNWYSKSNDWLTLVGTCLDQFCLV